MIQSGVRGSVSVRSGAGRGVLPRGRQAEVSGEEVERKAPLPPLSLAYPERASGKDLRRTEYAAGGYAVSAIDSPSSEPSARSSEQEMQVNVGVSRLVNALDSVVRSFCTRSRKSPGLSDSNATTNS